MMRFLPRKNSIARFVRGWEAPMKGRPDPGDKNCLIKPVPSPSELVAVGALKHQGGYIHLDPLTGASPLPICYSKHQIHGLTLNLLHSPGTDLFDYQAIPQLLQEPEAIDALKDLGKSMRMDAYHFPNFVGELPRHLLRFSRTGTTCWFDARWQDNGWRSLYGRKSIRSLVNRAEKKLDLRIVTLTDPKEIEGWLETLAQLHRERWQFDHVSSQFNDPVRIAQYRAVLSRSCLTLALDGKEPLAMHWGFTFSKVLLWHTPIINIRYLDYSPLLILLAGVARFCEESGLEGLDFGLGDEQYKSRFTNRRRPVFDVFIPVSAKSKVIYWLRRFIEPARLRFYAEQVLVLTQRVRTSLCRTRTRVVYFTSPANLVSTKSSEKDTLCEISDWMSLVDAFRRSGLTLYRHHYQRIKNGERLVCLCRRGCIVSMGWRLKQDENSPFVVCESGQKLLLPGKVIFYDFSTPPQHRRRGYCKNMLRAVLHHYQPLPVIISSKSTNTPALKAIRSAGFVKISGVKFK